MVLRRRKSVKESGIVAEEKGIDCDEFVTKGFVKEFFSYRTNRRVKMQVYHIGVVYRVAQLGAVLYVAYTMYIGNLWAEEQSERAAPNPRRTYSPCLTRRVRVRSRAPSLSAPRGVIEANPEFGDSPSRIDVADFVAEGYTFCSNASYSYALGSTPDRRFESPECRGEDMPEVTVRNGATVSFVTTYLEHEVIGFPCTTAAPAACAGRMISVENSGQCKCEAWTTVTPVAVEDMVISVDHAFNVERPMAGEGSWAGSSVVVPDAGLHGINTNLRFADGTHMHVPAGQRLSLPVRTWLQAAGIDLDARNPTMPPDVGDGRAPFYRTTGVRLDAVISYGNLDDKSSQEVEAKVSISASEGVMAGLGASVYHPVMRSGPRGNATFHRVTHFRQAVVVSFSGTGRVYRFNLLFFVMELVLVKVYLSLAVVLADLCVPPAPHHARAPHTHTRAHRTRTRTHALHTLHKGSVATTAEARWCACAQPGCQHVAAQQEGCDRLLALAHVEAVTKQA
jgi:hypothetical protein